MNELFNKYIIILLSLLLITGCGSKTPRNPVSDNDFQSILTLVIDSTLVENNDINNNINVPDYIYPPDADSTLENRVYILEEHKPGIIFIDSLTIGVPQDDIENIRKKLTDDNFEDDFLNIFTELSNAKSRKALQLYLLLTRNDIEFVDHYTESEDFYFLQISELIINDRGNKAVLYADFTCEGECGARVLYLFEKSGQWRIKKRYIISVS
ncbi:hypothetical protein [Marinigracilibium pacificum]|uniref:Lipoprotein n=1 Tax=Marinigracilibium pacificum TaxID=2729599 RepID=A0A848IXG2_9BACT|nr:hypothetical protein [Marinigracilibium pacificum]NMM48336.1 hypothetical protein [Marinigracilibium pacificum]